MSWRVICADVLDGLAQLPDASVQTVVTSPPYWGLRDYGTAAWDGGDADCDHLHKTGGTGSSTLGVESGGHALSDEARVRSTERSFVPFAAVCGKCGARRIDQQLGLEPTPEAYVERMVEVFREVRRVLRDDGTVWLNLGDSYAGTPGGPNALGASTLNCSHDGTAAVSIASAGVARRRIEGPGLKPKDLVGIPWRVAFALQADGWYLRSDIIWSKPNPMPESVTDRPTKAHEYLFLLSKASRYYFDADAVREPQGDGPMRWGSNEKHGWDDSLKARALEVADRNPAGRNIRSVWNIATEPFPGAHFATFPKKLVEPCVKAGSAIGDTVLDPFCGSGTVGVVSLRLGRSFVGIELNPTYAEMARHRISDDAPLFNVDAEVMPTA